jgi:hypothetical protein
MIDNYEALTLGDYMRVDAVLAKDAEEIDKQVEIVAILSGLSVGEVLALPLADYSRMAAETAFLAKYCKPAEIDKDWRLGDLVPTMDFTKITTAQYIDFQSFSKEFPASLPQLLSAFLVPEGKTYNEGYDVAEVVERVKALPLPVALGLSAFFLKRFATSIEDSLTSLGSLKVKDAGKAETIRGMTEEVEALLATAGAGFTR